MKPGDLLELVGIGCLAAAAYLTFGVAALLAVVGVAAVLYGWSLNA